MFKWLLRKLLDHNDNEDVSPFVYLCLVLLGFFWHINRQWGQLLCWGTKTSLYFSTSCQPPPSPFTGNIGSVLRVLLSSPPCLWRKPLKMITSVWQCRWTFVFPMNSLFLQVVFLDWALALIPLDAGETICILQLKPVLLIGTRTFSCRGHWGCTLFLFDSDIWTFSWSAGLVKICIELIHKFLQDWV